MLLLTSCSLHLSSNSSQRSEVDQPSINTFETSDLCPHVCWLGIHPGTTSEDEALDLIMTSDQIENGFTQKIDNTIQVYWYSDENKTIGSSVTLSLSNGIVESIYIGPLEPFTVKDFIELWGEPSEISIRLEKGMHDEKLMIYSLYYPSLSTKLLVFPGNMAGPNPNDQINLLAINIELNDSNRQPWKGYNQIEDYLGATSTPKTP